MKAEVAETLTHSLLIQQAAKWLQKKGCAVVITDMTHGGQETADAIGWKGHFSTLIECKASRADFLADRKKPFRIMPEMGMGALRYFCAPRGIIRREDELPDGWGLLEWTGEKLVMVKQAELRRHERGAREEISLLLSSIRRIGKDAPQGVSVRCYSMDSKCRATIGIEPEDPAK